MKSKSRGKKHPFQKKDPKEALVPSGNGKPAEETENSTREKDEGTKVNGKGDEGVR